jgi:heme-degrading monooxygenase HmoA
MSVLMTLRVKADPAKFEEYAAQNKEKMQAIANRGREHGAIHHAFYGSDDGTLLVIDEWDSPESFQAFFDASPDIGEVMQGSGASSEPEVTFWRKLEGHDEF